LCASPRSWPRHTHASVQPGLLAGDPCYVGVVAVGFVDLMLRQIDKSLTTSLLAIPLCYPAAKADACRP